MEQEIKNDRVAQFKQCLKTFGYRELDDETMAKPIAYMMIGVLIMPDKAIFKLFFRDYENKLNIFNNREFEFTKCNFETSDSLSNSIADIEQEICNSYSALLTSSKFPCNFYVSI